MRTVYPVGDVLTQGGVAFTPIVCRSSLSISPQGTHSREACNTIFDLTLLLSGVVYLIGTCLSPGSGG